MGKLKLTPLEAQVILEDSKHRKEQIKQDLHKRGIYSYQSFTYAFELGFKAYFDNVSTFNEFLPEDGKEFAIPHSLVKDFTKEIEAAYKNAEIKILEDGANYLDNPNWKGLIKKYYVDGCNFVADKISAIYKNRETVKN